MKKMLVPTTLALALVSPFALAADAPLAPQFYAGVAYEPITIGTSDYGDFDVSTVSVKGGVGLHKFFAVEARYGTSVSDDSRTVLGTQVNTELDHYYGAYAKGIVPLHESFSLYGLAGYTKAETSVSTAFGSSSGSDDGFSYGGGLTFHFNPNLAFNVEYMSYLDKDDYDIKGYGVGVSMMF